MSVLDSLSRGLAPRASWEGYDPAPGAGVTGSLSGSYVSLGSLAMVPSGGIARSATYRQVYLTNPWVWAAVNMLSRAVGRAPLHVFGLDERGRRVRIRGDVPQPTGRPTAGVSLDRLLSSPSDGLSRRALVSGTVKNRLVLGNGLQEILKSPIGYPVGLRRISWTKVRRVHERDGRPLLYELTERDARGRYRLLQPADVVHFGLGDDPESCVAPSPLEACRHTLALHDALVRHLVAYFGNAMRPSGHLSVEGLTTKVAEEIRAAITELYTSPENAGKVLVTRGKWEAMSDSLDHGQIVELIRLSREEIAATYAVPPPVLGILESAIKSNVAELRTQYVRDSAGQWSAEYEDELQAQLLAPQPSWSGLFVEFQLAEQLRPDLEARALVYQRLAPYFAVDEVRQLENMPALDMPGLSDVPWVSSGAQPLSAWKSSTDRPKGGPPSQQLGAADVLEQLAAAADAGASDEHLVELVRAALAT